MSCRWQVEVMLARVAAVLPPRGLPTKRLFLRFSALLFLCPSRLHFGPLLLLFGPLPLQVAFFEQRSHHGLQCFLVVG